MTFKWQLTAVIKNFWTLSDSCSCCTSCSHCATPFGWAIRKSLAAKFSRQRQTAYAQNICQPAVCSANKLSSSHLVAKISFKGKVVKKICATMRCVCVCVSVSVCVSLSFYRIIITTRLLWFDLSVEYARKDMLYAVWEYAGHEICIFIQLHFPKIFVYPAGIVKQGLHS